MSRQMQSPLLPDPALNPPCSLPKTPRLKTGPVLRMDGCALPVPVRIITPLSSAASGPLPPGDAMPHLLQISLCTLLVPVVPAPTLSSHTLGSGKGFTSGIRICSSSLPSGSRRAPLQFPLSM